MRTLLLIDAHSLIHRAFHALPPLTAPDGKPIQAIYGLANIFLKLWREEKPAYAAACLDRPEPTMRKEKYEAYKAQRPEAPEVLVSQIIEARRFFAEFGIRTFELPGYEADDLIATLAERFRGEPDLRIVILTGDLDTLQLVENKKVVVRTFKKGISETFIYDEDAVYARYGLRPDQLADWKALVGDPSDNVKGVTGIGPKTAGALLKRHGTVEGIFRNLAEEPKIGPKLAGGEAQVGFSKELVTLVRNAPIGDLNLAELAPARDDRRLAAYFGEKGFESLRARLGFAEASSAPRASPKEAGGAADEGLLAAHGMDDAVWVRDVPRTEAEIRAYGSDRVKVGFDLKRMLRECRHAGSELRPPYWDLGVAFWLLDPDLKTYTPSFLVKKFLRRESVGAEETLRALYRYAARKLGEYRLMDMFRDIEMPLVPVLFEMEEWGVCVNRDKLRALAEEMETNLATLARRIYREIGEEFNLNSPQQLGRVLAEKIFPRGAAVLKRTPGGKLSTRAEELAAHKDAHPAIPLILEYREGFKILSTYVRPFGELAVADGKLHTTFVQTGTSTGRLSSQNPNLQNIPRDSRWAKAFREVVEAPPAYRLLACDYSQLELRILAALAEDPKMIAAFERGEDIHRATAAKVFGVPYDAVTPEMRRQAKTLNFGLIYGMGASSFQRASGLSREDALHFIRAYFEEFSRVREWQETVKSHARTFGYVETPTGRRRYLPNIVSGSPRYAAEAERAAVNHPIQGCGADIIKLAMIRVRELIYGRVAWRENIRMILSVHDELLFEVPESMISEAVPAIRDVMEGVFPLRVPLKVDVSSGAHWGALAAIV
ncbi:MAG: hypothetical protein HY436_01645 [Candidatus Liptonbacteria bacterium]|nr:hypothetical protein [Candidatus Liptonbacteria bacterium]